MLIEEALRAAADDRGVVYHITNGEKVYLGKRDGRRYITNDEILDDNWGVELPEIPFATVWKAMRDNGYVGVDEDGNRYRVVMINNYHEFQFYASDLLTGPRWMKCDLPGEWPRFVDILVKDGVSEVFGERS